MKARGKGKYTTSSGWKDRYDNYINIIKENKTSKNTEDYKVNSKVFGNVLKSCNIRLSMEIMTNPKFEFHVPFRLGHLSIKKRKRRLYLDENGKLNKKNLKPDWKKTKEEGKIVYHENNHTNGYYARWLWSKKFCFVPNCKVYYFEPTRYNKRTLATFLKDEDSNIDYYDA